MTRLTKLSVLAGVAVLLAAAAAPAGADLIQSGSLSLTAGGNDLLPGTGISFVGYTWTGDGSNLNMQGFTIENVVDANGITLDLNDGNLSGSGATALTTARSLSSGSITILDVGTVNVGAISTRTTSNKQVSGNVTIGGAAAGDEAGQVTVASIDTRASGSLSGTTSGAITINSTGAVTVTGDIVTYGYFAGSVSATHVGAFSIGNLDAYGTTKNGGTITLDGGDKSGLFTAARIKANGGTLSGTGGATTIHGYLGVIVNGGVDLHGYDATPGQQTLSIYDIGASGVTVTGDIDTRVTHSQSSFFSGNIYIGYDPTGALDAIEGNISLTGSLLLDSAFADSHDGSVRLAATGDITIGSAANPGAHTLDLTQIQSLLFNGGGQNTIYDEIDASGGDAASQFQLAGGTGTIYYYYQDGGVNSTLFAGATGGVYDLSGGGQLRPLVPEPATVAFLAIGGLAMAGGMAARRRRR